MVKELSVLIQDILDYEQGQRDDDMTVVCAKVR